VHAAGGSQPLEADGPELRNPIPTGQPWSTQMDHRPPRVQPVALGDEILSKGGATRTQRCAMPLGVYCGPVGRCKPR
jgi:hypothetical protein